MPALSLPDSKYTSVTSKGALCSIVKIAVEACDSQTIEMGRNEEETILVDKKKKKKEVRTQMESNGLNRR